MKVLGSTITRLSKTTQYRLVSSTVSKFGVGVSFDLVGMTCVDDSWFFKGCSDFVDDVGFEKVKVQLGLFASTESETAYLAFHFSV